MHRFDSITTTLRWFLALLLVAIVAGCGGGGGGSAANTTAPTVSFTAPAHATTGVALNANITATFSEAMNAATITTTTFTLTQGITPVPGAVTYAGSTAIFNPTSNLIAGTIYTATLNRGGSANSDSAISDNLAQPKPWKPRRTEEQAHEKDETESRTGI